MPAEADRAVPDAVAGHWVDARAPLRLRPYLRLARIERPIGWWLLLLPCWWSAALAAIDRDWAGPNPWHLVLFLVGAVAMRGAGSTYNDIADRDLDARVERTRDRPLPSGAVTPRQALGFLVLQALVGLAVLLSLNRTAILAGLASLLPVVAYPFMKRVMPMPQLVLGLAFAWGALMGWTAASPSLSPFDAPALLLYLGAIAWVVGYDTIYAVQDLEDDAVAGIKSSARFFGPRLKPAVALCFAITVVAIGAAMWRAGAGTVGFLGLALFAAHLANQVRRLDPADGRGALRLFRSNRDAGLILFAGLCLDAAVQALP